MEEAFDCVPVNGARERGRTRKRAYTYIPHTWKIKKEGKDPHQTNVF